MADDFLAFLAECLDARADWDKACCARSAPDRAAVLYLALHNVAGLARLYPDRPLPLLSSQPAFEHVIAAGREVASAMRDAPVRAEEPARTLASLPNAATLLAQARHAGDEHEVFGYTLWRRAQGWSLTNAYGVDNVMFLSTEEDFQRLLEAERAGRELGLLPHPAHADADTEEVRHAWRIVDQACWLLVEHVLDTESSPPATGRRD